MSSDAAAHILSAEGLVESARPGQNGSNGHSLGPPSPNPVRRRKLLTRNLVIFLVLVVVAAAAVAYGLTRFDPVYYGGRAAFAFTTTASGDTTTASRRLQTEAQILTSRGLLEPIAESNGLSYAQLRKRVSATISSDADVVQVTVQDRDPGQAQRLTTLLAGSYISSSVAVRPTSEEVSLSTNLRELKQRRDQLDGQLNDPGLDDIRERGISTEVSQLTLQIGTLYSQLATAQAQRLSAGAPQLITTPYVLAKPVSPDVKRSLAMGALVGLGIGTCIVLALYQLRREAA